MPFHDSYGSDLSPLKQVQISARDNAVELAGGADSGVDAKLVTSTLRKSDTHLRKPVKGMSGRT